MKKLKVIIPIIVLLFLITLFGLSFLRLPINLLSQEIIERETKGLVGLNSLSNQTLKILRLTFGKSWFFYEKSLWFYRCSNMMNF